MVDLKIGVISPHGNAKEKYGHCAHNTGCRLIFRKGHTLEAPAIALEMQNQMGVDAIITLGIPMEVFGQMLSVPVFPTYPSNFDVFLGCHEAKKIGNLIGFTEIPFTSMHYDFAHIVSILNAEVKLYRFKTLETIPDTVRQVAEDGCDVMVTTGGMSYGIARELGLQAILILPEEMSFKSAVDKIIAVFQARQTEMEKTKWLSAVMDNSREGMMVYDHDNRAVVINPVAQRFMRLEQHEIVGRHRDEIKSSNPLFRKFMKIQDGMEVVHGNGKDYVVRKQMIRAENILLGVMYSASELRDLQRLEMDTRKKMHAHGFAAANTFENIRGSSPAFAEIRETARKYARSGASILLYGESGSGKEMFAQSIHNASQSANGPFVDVNCAALADNLLESELFGYEDGAFTGARKGGKPGLFEMAHMGTLFLDEIGDMPLHIQVKLLRVLQERTVRRMGGGKNIPVDVRLIFATNKDLRAEVVAGKFRSDLYHRINVLPLTIPPLREHKEDIGEIADAMMRRLSAKIGIPVSLSERSIRTLQQYDWPGNIRELQNVLERSVVMEEFDDRSFADMVGKLSADALPSPAKTYLAEGDILVVRVGTLRSMENEIIKCLYERYGGDKKKVEYVLDISATTFWRRMRELQAEGGAP